MAETASYWYRGACEQLSCLVSAGDDEGVAIPTPAAVAAAQRVLDALYAAGAEMPAAAVGEEADVVLEWLLPGVFDVFVTVAETGVLSFELIDLLDGHDEHLELVDVDFVVDRVLSLDPDD